MDPAFETRRDVAPLPPPMRRAGATTSIVWAVVSAACSIAAPVLIGEERFRFVRTFVHWNVVGILFALSWTTFVFACRRRRPGAVLHWFVLVTAAANNVFFILFAALLCSVRIPRIVDAFSGGPSPIFDAVDIQKLGDGNCVYLESTGVRPKTSIRTILGSTKHLVWLTYGHPFWLAFEVKVEGGMFRAYEPYKWIRDEQGAVVALEVRRRDETVLRLDF